MATLFDRFPSSRRSISILSSFYGGKRWSSPVALGPVQGVGYIEERLARLTGLPVKDNTQTDHTLDSSTITLPTKIALYTQISHMTTR
ncbi:hypothetical protein BYT27DRAFT_7263387 [Phlegmacium glaucopus]|nr:hypothetical protein BYT27DRAFT_7263387 [Phlegmacium glaucopus]